MVNFPYHFSGQRRLSVQPRSANLSEWPFTLYVWFHSWLTLTVFPYLFYSLPSHAFPFSLPQSSTWPISVRLLSCTILCVLASCYSSVALLPVAVPLIPSLPPSLLLHVVKTLYISLKCSLLGCISTYICLSLLRNNVPFCFAFLLNFSSFGSTFYFNLSACLPPPAEQPLPLFYINLSWSYILAY